MRVSTSGVDLSAGEGLQALRRAAGQAMFESFDRAMRNKYNQGASAEAEDLLRQMGAQLADAGFDRSNLERAKETAGLVAAVGDYKALLERRDDIEALLARPRDSQAERLTILAALEAQAQEPLAPAHLPENRPLFASLAGQLEQAPVVGPLVRAEEAAQQLEELLLGRPTPDQLKEAFGAIRDCHQELLASGPQYAQLAELMGGVDAALRAGKPGPALAALDDTREALEGTSRALLQEWVAGYEKIGLASALREVEPERMRQMEELDARLAETRGWGAQTLADLAHGHLARQADEGGREPGTDRYPAAFRSRACRSRRPCMRPS